MADQHYFGSTGRVVSLGKIAADSRFNSEDAEKVGGGECGLECFRAAITQFDIAVPAQIEKGEIPETSRLFFPILEIEIAHSQVAARARIARLHHNKLLRFGVGQRPQQECLNNTEHGRCRTDAERERKTGNNRKRRAFN